MYKHFHRKLRKFKRFVGAHKNFDIHQFSFLFKKKKIQTQTLS